MLVLNKVDPFKKQIPTVSLDEAARLPKWVQDGINERTTRMGESLEEALDRLSSSPFFEEWFWDALSPKQEIGA